MYVLHFNQTPMIANYPAHLLKNMSQASIWTFSLNNNKHLGKALHLSIDEEDSVVKESDGILYNLDGSSSDEVENGEYVEMQRRRKIGLANKGKVPWNKGQRHREETRELIKQRTIEALRNPKIKKKMSEYRRFHSAESKAKIGFALRKLWEERLKRKRLQEKCYLTWAAAISDTAKIGGHGQQELEWDSYEKMKADIILQHIQWKAEKAKAKEFAELKAKRTAEAKAAKMTRLAQERKEKEQKLRAKESKKAIKKLGDHKELFGLSRLKLKAQMTKVDDPASLCHGQLMAPVPVTETATQVQAAIEKWDLEFIKKEKMRKRISFADQIRAAKNRNMESNENGILKSPFSDRLLEEKQDT